MIEIRLAHELERHRRNMLLGLWTNESDLFYIDNSRIVKRGICEDDGHFEYEVLVIESDTLYGSGNHEDPPEIADNREMLCYYCWFSSPSKWGIFKSNRNGFLTIKDAVASIERNTPVLWKY